MHRKTPTWYKGRAGTFEVAVYVAARQGRNSSSIRSIESSDKAALDDLIGVLMEEISGASPDGGPTRNDAVEILEEIVDAVAEARYGDDE